MEESYDKLRQPIQSRDMFANEGPYVKVIDFPNSHVQMLGSWTIEKS